MYGMHTHARTIFKHLFIYLCLFIFETEVALVLNSLYGSDWPRISRDLLDSDSNKLGSKMFTIMPGPNFILNSKQWGKQKFLFFTPGKS